MRPRALLSSLRRPVYVCLSHTQAQLGKLVHMGSFCSSSFDWQKLEILRSDSSCQNIVEDRPAVSPTRKHADSASHLEQCHCAAWIISSAVFVGPWRRVLLLDCLLLRLGGDLFDTLQTAFRGSRPRRKLLERSQSHSSASCTTFGF